MDRSKWEYKKLGEVCDLYQPKTISSDMLVPDGKYLVYGANGVIGKYNKYNHESPEVLMTCRGATCGTINVSVPYSWINGNAMVVHPRTTDLNAQYLVYQLKAADKTSVITGAAQPQITRQMLQNLPFVVAPITDQQRIVAELDCLNEMIALKQEQLKEFDKLAQSIFYDMFGDDGGFEKVKLGDVVEVVSGLVDPNIEPYCSQLHVSPANIVSGTNEIVNCVKAKDEGLISDKYPFKTGMVLYSKIRPNLNKVAVANFDGICSADMYPLTVLPKANNVYITKLLSSKQFLEYAIKNSGRARMPKLNRETLFSYSFKLPPLALQQQFAEKIQAIEAQKELVKQSIAETQQLLDSRMDYYFD